MDDPEAHDPNPSEARRLRRQAQRERLRRARRRALAGAAVTALALTAAVALVAAAGPEERGDGERADGVAAADRRDRSGLVSAERPRLPATPTSLEGSGELRLVGGASRSGAGEPLRFTVEVERGLGVNGRALAKQVERTLYDRRSWAARRGVAMARQDDLTGLDFQVTLASPATTDRLCAPIPTNGFFSCENAGRVVINAMRWRDGAEPFGSKLRTYRRYVINHEVGHALGLGHQDCPAFGARAPVMVQQTKGTDGCKVNPWPQDGEI